MLADLFRDVERMHSMGHITDWQLENAREAYARTVSAADSKIGDAANWAMDKAKDTLESAAEYVRDRATTAVATYTKADPIRAVLIAAGTTTIRPIPRTESDAARLGCFTVDSSHRWTGTNKTASVSAQVSAGRNGRE